MEVEVWILTRSQMLKLKNRIIIIHVTLFLYTYLIWLFQIYGKMRIIFFVNDNLFILHKEYEINFVVINSIRKYSRLWMPTIVYSANEKCIVTLVLVKTSCKRQVSKTGLQIIVITRRLFHL